MSGVLVLGLDPGFASTGYALVELLPDREEVLKLGVISTEKAQKKRQVLASDDNFRRARELCAQLETIRKDAEAGLCKYINGLCAESMSFPRHAGTAAKMAMCWGVISALSEVHGIPLSQATPKELKKRLCGSGTASKEEVQEVLRRRYGGEKMDLLLEGLPRGQHEHPYDALASVVACLDGEVLRTIRKMSKP